MHQEEPSLLDHIVSLRNTQEESGVSSIIYCGKVRSESELIEALNVHRNIIEGEVNKNEVHLTGLLMGQVNFY